MHVLKWRILPSVQLPEALLLKATSSCFKAERGIHVGPNLISI